MPLSAVWLLLIGNVRSHLGRFIGACLAISFTTAILLAALVGQQVVRTRAPTAAQSLLGAGELHLAATDTIHPVLDEQLLAAVRADPRVSSVRTASIVRAVDMPGNEKGELDVERFYTHASGGSGGWIPGRREGFIAWHDGGAQGELVDGQWPSNQDPDPVEIVVPAVIWGQPVGAWRRLESDSGVHRSRVVGILPADMATVASPAGIRLALRQISPKAAEKLAGGTLQTSDARITLNNADDLQPFLREWRGRLADYPGIIELWDADTLERAALEGTMAEGARIAVQSAVLLATACVMCIAYSVQGNAVRERAAQFSLLRSLGAARVVLPLLVVAEAVLLALASLVGAVLFVWAAMYGLAAYLPVLKTPSSPAAASIAWAGGVTLFGVLCGAVWPAYLASRRLPGEYTAESEDSARAARMARQAAVAALVVAALAALALAATPSQSLPRTHAITWVGVPCLAITAVLLTPLVLRATCRIFARPVAWLTRTEPLVLADHMASDGARSAGSIIAISIGLGGFIWTICWGASMLDAFIIDQGLPRWLVSVHPYGLNQQESERLLASPEFVGYHALTLYDTHLVSTGEPTPTLVMGIDPGRSLASRDSTLPFRFVEGDREHAIADLERGDACLVSAWYAASHHVHPGDQLAVAAPSTDGRGERSYRVAGVVELTGWRMATKLNKVRYHGIKHKVMLVLDAAAARRDFPVGYVNFLLGNPPAAPDGAIPGFRSDLPKEVAYEASRKLRQSVEASLAAEVDLSQPVRSRPNGEDDVVVESRVVQVDDLDRTRSSLRGEWGGAAVQRMAQAPLAILMLSLFSICGALIASLQSRSRELGVLRSCGMQRSGLARLALAEALLLGLAAIPISALLGGVGAALMLQVASVVGFRLDFAGIQPDFTAPWVWLWPGVVTTFAVCSAAGLWAAWRIGRVAPATLISNSSRG